MAKDVSQITKQELFTRLTDLVVRTQRGDDLVQRNPRELPRRLRVLLLAIDGSHTVQLYVQTLKGFGDVADLLLELMVFGLVQLRSPHEVLARKPPAEQFADLNNLLDDSRFNSGHASEVLYGSTAAGSFDDMLRVAEIEVPEYQAPPPSPPPAPVDPKIQKLQIESVFDLLESVRGERRSLKNKLVKMERLRAAAIKLDNENQRLFTYLFAVSSVCVALLVVLVIVVLRR
jgi:hypothetical protein